MSVHETSLFFRGKSDRNVMIAPLEGAEGAMGVVVHGNQGKGGMGSPSDTPLAPYSAWGCSWLLVHFRVYGWGVRWLITRFSLKAGAIGIRERVTWKKLT